MTIESKAKSKAKQEATKLINGQVALLTSAAFALLGKFDPMYYQVMSIVDKIQTIRKVTRKVILLGSIFDTGNPEGTAANLALNVATIVDKKALALMSTEYQAKVLAAVRKYA
jgi:hypothetical protein